MAGELADYMSEKLDTRVEIGRMQVSLLGRVVIDDVNLWDRQQRLLLCATRTGAQIDLWKLIDKGDIVINSAQLFGVKANVVQERPDSALNYQFILDAFASKDTTKKPLPHIEVRSILARHANIKFDRKWQPQLTDRFDANHLEVRDLSLKASLNVLTSDTLNVELDKLSFREKCGLVLQEASGTVSHGKKSGWQLSDLKIATAKSLLVTPNLTYKKEQVSAALEANITPSEFSPFLPALRQLEDSWNLRLVAKGDKQHISIPHLNLSHEGGAFTLNASAEADHWRDSIPHLQADINQLSLNAGLENIITPLLSKNRETSSEQSQKLIDLLRKLDKTDINGQLSYSKNNIQGDLSLTCGLGTVNGRGSYQQGKLNAHALTEDFRLGTLLQTGKDSTSLVGNITAEVDIDAQLKGKGALPDGKVHAIVKEADIKGYRYHDITLDATHKNGTYSGNIISNDPSAKLNAEVRACLSGDSPYIQGYSDIENLDLHTTHLAHASRFHRFASRIGIDLQGHQLENMEGHISIPHLIVSNADTTFTLTNLQLISQPVGRERHVRLTSPYLTAEADGDFDPLLIGSYIQQLGHNWLPDAIDAPQHKPAYTNARIAACIIDPYPIQYFTGTNLQLPDGPMVLDARMESDKELIDATASAPNITLGGFKLQKMKATLSSEHQQMKTHISMEQTMKGVPIEFNFDINSKEDRLFTQLTWDNHQSVLNNGALTMYGTMERNATGGLSLVAELQPSQVHINDTIWDVHPAQLYFLDGRLYIDNFRLSTLHNERSLSIQGTASTQNTDTLSIDLKDIDLNYIFTLARVKPISFGGLATGHLVARHVFKNPVAHGNVIVPKFYFNEAHMGLLNAYVSWGDSPGTLKAKGAVTDFDKNSHIDADFQIHLFKDPIQHMDLNAQFRNANCAFLQRYLGRFLNNVQGRASGRCRIYGPLKQIDLDADVLSHGMELTIAATGARYHTLQDTVAIRPGRIEFKNLMAYDSEGKLGQKEHSALVNGEVTYQYFKNICFDFDINANHILGYDQKDFGDMAFYGTVFADGKVKLKGHPGRTDIDIDATPVGKSFITYNASGPETITKAKFISFVDRSEELKASLDGTNNQQVTKPAGDTYLNFNLHLTPEAELRLLMNPKTEEYISLNGTCNNLYATYYNKGKFQMYGTLHVDHGIYKMTIQDVIRKDFRFRNGGTIVFGGNPFSADLNLQALYTVPSVSLNDLSAKGTFSNSNVKVNCIMNIGGTAGQPRVTFDFDIPNVNEDERRMVRSLISTEEERNMQVIYLLGIGRFYTYDYSGTQTQSETAMNSLLSSTLSDQLNQVFNSITHNTNWNFGANLSTGTMGWSDMDIEGMLSGRLLNNRLLINGSFGYRDNPVAASNFIGDFDIQYLLNKSGSVVLKAYSETNDRYFTKSALTTQGIGVLVKKDFRRFSDLFSFLRRKQE